MGTVRLLRQPSSPGTEKEDTPSDPELVRAAQDGALWAQEALFRRHVRLAAGLAHRLLASHDADVDDLVQDCFVQALQNLHRLRVPEAFASWLGSIVVRTAAKRLRRRRLQRRLGLVRDEAPDMDALVSRAAPSDLQLELQRIYSRLDRFPTDERIALVLRKVDGMSLAQVAEAMGVSLSTAKRKLRQAEERMERIKETSR
jgi:RNA polymerase sigma-70 factor (ECF subfamily)